MPIQRLLALRLIFSIWPLLCYRFKEHYVIAGFWQAL